MSVGMNEGSADITAGVIVDRIKLNINIEKEIFFVRLIVSISNYNIINILLELIKIIDFYGNIDMKKVEFLLPL